MDRDIADLAQRLKTPLKIHTWQKNLIPYPKRFLGNLKSWTRSVSNKNARQNIHRNEFKDLKPRWQKRNDAPIKSFAFQFLTQVSITLLSTKI